MMKIKTALLLSCAPVCAAMATDQNPNIIIFLADDAGYADFGFMGSKDFATPNLDRLVGDGVKFTDMHVSGSVSGPSRSGLMTGRYQQRFGCETNGAAEIGVPLNETLMPEYLKPSGYKTAVFGKWHLGSDDNEHPNVRGFDEFYGFLGGHRNYFSSPKDLEDRCKGVQHNGEYQEFEGYLTDVLADRAIDFIDKNSDNPFFIYLSFSAVHTPLQATAEDLARFEGNPRQKVAAMTWALDRAVGNVLDKLEREGVMDNTFIVFLSDNGGDGPKCNEPLKANKGTEYEGGHRVICAMKWGDRIGKGVEYNKLSSTLDLLPTFLDIASVEQKDSYNLDGVSLVPHLTGKDNSAPHDWLFWRIERWHAVRYNDYKYIYADGIGDVLYDLNSDLGERKNISKSNPDIYNLMKKRLAEWESEMKEPLVSGEKDWEEVKAMMYKDYFEDRMPRFITPGALKKAKANGTL